MRILVIDVGGNNVKIRQPEQHTVVKIPSGPALTAARMVKAVMRATADWKYDAVSIGYPGPVANGRPAREPHNLGRRLDALRLPSGVPQAGAPPQRRGDAGPRQLPRGAHAVSRASAPASDRRS